MVSLSAPATVELQPIVLYSFASVREKNPQGFVAMTE